MDYSKKCTICKSTQILKKRNYKFKIPKNSIKFTEIIKKERFVCSVNFCKKCGNLYLYPRFSEEEYNIIFPSKDIKDHLNITSNQTILRASLNYNFLKSFINLKSNKRPKILDYGGAAGNMLIPFLNKFDCYLADYNKYDLPKAIQYLGRSLDNIEDLYQFDIIMALRVLEHVNDPLNLIKTLTHVITDNGIIYVQVPLGCLREWKFLDTPFRHINYFSEQSLYNCFKIAGLNIIYLKTRYYKIGGNPGWKIDIIGKKRSEGQKQKKIKFHSTTQQQNLKYFYYTPYIIRNNKFKLGEIKKILKILKRRLNPRKRKN
ncbi:MAG: class I SAM-dependent methyltransferase [Promethearchaeota archaeon]